MTDTMKRILGGLGGFAAFLLTAGLIFHFWGYNHVLLSYVIVFDLIALPALVYVFYVRRVKARRAGVHKS
jgi:hypothetical protein